MEYLQLIKVRSDNVVINSGTNAIIEDVESYNVIGETDDRLWQLDLYTDDLILKKVFIDGEVQDRSLVDIETERTSKQDLKIERDTYYLIKQWCFDQRKCEEYYINRGIADPQDDEYLLYLNVKDEIINNQAEKRSLLVEEE